MSPPQANGTTAKYSLTLTLLSASIMNVAVMVLWHLALVDGVGVYTPAIEVHRKRRSKWMKQPVSVSV